MLNIDVIVLLSQWIFEADTIKNKTKQKMETVIGSVVIDLSNKQIKFDSSRIVAKVESNCSNSTLNVASLFLSVSRAYRQIKVQL